MATGGSGAGKAAADPDRLVSEFYAREYQPLIRLAVLLGCDLPTAEEVVEDAFVAMHRGWRRLRDNEEALRYLRRAVVSKSHAAQRHRPIPVDSAEQKTAAERPAVLAALRGVPRRQREVIVLKYFASLSEDEIAAAMGVRSGAVNGYLTRGMSSLWAFLDN